MIKIVAISDTHGRHEGLDIPFGDILVHAGDLTGTGTLAQVAKLNDFLGALPHTHKIVVAGNHDFCFQDRPREARALLTEAIYLQDEEAIVESIRFYGSPWSPLFFDWAFMLPRGREIRAKWDAIPADTDVLITHGPPWGQGDMTYGGERAGCRDLLDVVERIRPKLHVFGHIHEGAGIYRIPGNSPSRSEQTVLVNPSICDVHYRPVQPPIIIEYDPAAGVQQVYQHQQAPGSDG
jgi:Icc-related predicted phosphoesterase